MLSLLSKVWWLMKINKNKIVIFAFSLIIGFLISLQIVNDAKNFAFININTVAIMSNELDLVNKDIENLKYLIEKSKNELNQYEVFQNKGEDISIILEEELYKMKAVAGYTNLRGEGITVKLSDNMSNTIGDVNYDIVHDIDVTIIINDLINAGAEAISINGKRILSNSEIVCIGPLIRINGEGVAAPFFIKAIGDKDLLSAAINAPNTYAYELKEIYGIGIETMKSDFVMISKYIE
jgi:uncharacterized protein YlxW (UPF0749 family)